MQAARMIERVRGGVMQDRIETYLDARRRGTEWLLRQLNGDGSIGPVDEGFYYYRLPWTLTVAGETRHGVRICDWVRSNQFAVDGDFVGASPRGVEAYAYENATFVYGAQMLRQYDLSYGGYQRLMTHFDPASGGFCHLAEGSGIARDENIPTAAQAGKTALMMGDLSTAERVGDWFRRVWELQPELPDRLYYVYSAETQTLVTEFTEERAFHYVVEAQQPRQRFTCGGIAAAFLCRLYQASPRPEYLELARQYQAFSMNTTERQFEVPQVCKTGWGSALLYQITREEAYREWTIRVGDYYVQTQHDDGHWENRAPYRSLPHNITVTAEFVVHLDTLIGALSLTDAPIPAGVA
jgi:hypothetical protein